MRLNVFPNTCRSFGAILSHWVMRAFCPFSVWVFIFPLVCLLGLDPDTNPPPPCACCVGRLRTAAFPFLSFPLCVCASFEKCSFILRWSWHFLLSAHGVQAFHIYVFEQVNSPEPLLFSRQPVPPRTCRPAAVLGPGPRGFLGSRFCSVDGFISLSQPRTVVNARALS